MRIPASTYRLQISPAFDLATATSVLPYLHDLGVDWVYVSPLLVAAAGSAHGYDVTDTAGIDPARGGPGGLAALAGEADRLGMGLLVDIVPNHMGVAEPAHNQWWWDVLAVGPESQFATAFDIDWAAGGGRLRLPVVGDDDLLPGDRIRGLTLADGELRYRGLRFPVAQATAEPGDDPDQVHARQHYELISWRRADAELNYRRFFAVNTLAGIRVEDPDWFERSHREIRRWFAQGLVDGVRVDHPDGLRDPGGYLADLAAATGGAYTLVEKILCLTHPDDPAALGIEALPDDWPVQGTTGYDALALIDRVLIDPAGRAPLTAIEERLRGHLDWAELARSGKLEVARGILHSEVRRLAREALADSRLAGILDHDSAVDAIAEIVASYDVYRTYLPTGREHLDHAVAVALEHRPDLTDALEALHPVLADPAADVAQRMQQTSGMVMAKGVEDRSFYRWSVLTSLNEVGGEPDAFCLDVARFHELMAGRQRAWPHAMVAGTTHDTKRSEDTRSRISVLAEVPELWSQALDQLLGLVPVPDRGLANLLWQAILGSWPASADRLHGYATKAMREATQGTTWAEPVPDFEEAMGSVVDAALYRPDVACVLGSVLVEVAAPGRSNSLAAKLLALTVPGVPDVYQGSELWEHSLVDPDNRRPVDFDARAELLARLRDGWRPTLGEGLDDDGAVKLHLVHTALTLRRDRPELFTGYTELAADGPAAQHALAFDRGGAITVVTRLPIGLRRDGGWRETALPLPQGEWRDALTDRPVAVDASGAAALTGLLAQYPVALLVRDE